MLLTGLSITTRKRTAPRESIKELISGHRNLIAALVAALAEVFVQGVSTRKVKAITEAGLKKATGEVLTEAGWQRCHVRFLRNARDYLPRAYQR
jgi:transposase-like protein